MKTGLVYLWLLCSVFWVQDLFAQNALGWQAQECGEESWQSLLVAGAESLVFSWQNKSPKKKIAFFHLAKLDTDFEVVQEERLHLPANWKLLNTFQGDVYSLYVFRETPDLTRLHLIEVRNMDLATRESDWGIPNLKPWDLRLVGGTLYLIGEAKGSIILTSRNLETGSRQSWIYQQENSTLLDVFWETEAWKIACRKEGDLEMMKLGLDGFMNSEYILEFSEDRIVNGARLVQNGETEFLFGTWRGKKANKTEGIFIKQIETSEIEWVKFADWPLFLEMAGEEQVLEKKLKGKKKLELRENYAVYWHPVQQVGGEPSLVAEIAHPKYKMVNFLEEDEEGRPVTVFKEVLERWESNLFLACRLDAKFDMKGLFQMQKENVFGPQLRNVSQTEGEKVIFLHENQVKSLGLKNGLVESESLVIEKVHFGLKLGLLQWKENGWVLWGKIRGDIDFDDLERDQLPGVFFKKLTF